MNTRALAFVLISGALFGFGLSLSTMIQPEVVLSFLRFTDFGLLLVLGGAAGVTLLAYQFIPRIMAKPWFAASFGKHAAAMNAQTIGGAALFGIGWGISGVCPGPAIAGLGAGSWPLIVSVAAMFAGAYVQGRWFGK
ncbi:MAG: DUF6691 family protein [Burkholderiaceae bacterium]